MSKKIARSIAAFMLAIVLSSCSSQSADTPTALAMASGEEFDFSVFSERELELVGVEANWMCDAQRISSTEPGGVEQARSAALADADISTREYDEFRAQLGERLDLRQAVFAQFLTVCGR